MADSKKVLEIIKAIGLKMEAEKEYLTELDQPIGDSDHGVNMAGDLQRWRESFLTWRERI